MSRGFLFRRLAPLVPCVLPHIGTGNLSIRNKYDVASFRDVFMSAHYWRLFAHLSSPPRRIVDLGAHCGHFSLLCHLALLERFGVDSAEYIMVEALPRLIPVIQRVVKEAGFEDQATIIQGLVGKKNGTESFRTDSRNLLSSSVVSDGDGSGEELIYQDLDTILAAENQIDILKIDIEGSEFDLLENYRHLLTNAKLLLIEVHGSSDRQLEFESRLTKCGLVTLSPAILKDSERLLFYGSPAHARP